jgi:tetrahydromethanopterin S-methyltransferase subunit H
MTDAKAAAVNISSTAGRKEVETALQEIGNLSVSVKRKQFDAYQKWAVKVCGEAHNTFTSWGNWMTSGYMGAFDETVLTSVDQGLLAPETARLFNDVVQEFFAKMSGDGRYWKTKDLAEDEKKKMEEF